MNYFYTEYKYTLDQGCIQSQIVLNGKLPLTNTYKVKSIFSFKNIVFYIFGK